MEALFFAHLKNLTLSSTLTGGATSWPKLVGGEDILTKLRFCVDQNGQTVQVSRTVSAIKASLGRQQIKPEDGTFKLKLGADPESAGVNTTAALAYNISADDLATALNALTDAALDAPVGPFTVADRDGSYFIVAADRSAVEFSCVDNELWPSSKVHIASRDYDEGLGYELRLNQAPVAQTATFGSIVPAIPYLQQVRAGATNSGVITTELQRLIVPPENPDGFSFCLKRGYRKTAPIVIGGNDNVEALTELLNAKAGTDGTSSGFVDEGEAFAVYAAPNGAIIEFLGTLAGVNQDLLEVGIVAEAGADTLIKLPTKTPSMATLLRKANPTTKEISAVYHLTLWLVNEQDSEKVDEYTFHVPITLMVPVNMDDLIAAADVNWATPLSREAYLKHSPSQIATGQRHYLISAFGNGSATEFTITHNLNTRYLLVAVQGAGAAGRFLDHGTDYEIEIVSDNAIKLIFAVAPTTNQYIGQLTSAAHDANFEPHTHGIDEIVDLEARLSAMEEAIADLQASAAVGSGGTRDPAAGTVIAEQSFRPIAEAYPLGLDLVAALSSSTAAASASSPAAAGAAAINTVADIPQEVLARFGDSNILGAIHDSAAEALPSPKPAASAANKGKVYQNRTLAAVRLNGDGARDSYLLQPGEFCGCDGRALYALTAPGVPNGAFAFTVNTSTDTLSIPGVTLPNGTPVMCLSSTTLPSGLGAALTQRYVINSAAGSCKLSATVGGSALDITDAGTGTHYIFATAGTTTSFFPRDFERQLFISHVAESKLRVKGKCTGMFGFEAAMFSLSTAAGRFGQKITQGRWRLVVRIGVDLQEDTPATTRANLKRIVWNADPVLDELVHVTRDVAEVHTFGFQIARTAADAWTITKCVNGFWSASAATIDAANFWLTAELVEWDCEDMPDPEGVVVLLGLDKTNAKADSGIGKIKFT